MEPLKPNQRFRCVACGNLTRFDVISTVRKKEFNHFSIGGVMTIEESEILEEVIEQVVCRWCGHGREIEVIEGPDTG